MFIIRISSSCKQYFRIDTCEDPKVCSLYYDEKEVILPEGTELIIQKLGEQIKYDGNCFQTI
jgi:hypothetical protein